MTPKSPANYFLSNHNLTRAQWHTREMENKKKALSFYSPVHVFWKLEDRLNGDVLSKFVIFYFEYAVASK